MELKHQRNCHALYNLEYHIVFITEYKKRCITEDVFQTIKSQIERVAELNHSTIEEINYESDHVHILLSAPPSINLSVVVNSMKSTSARIVRKMHEEHLKQYYEKPYFWSRSYLILSSGGTPIEVIKEYIRNQNGED